jgi:putative transposase
MKKKQEPPVWRQVLKRLHFPIEIILLCVRGYVAYPLSLRHLEEMMQERGVSVDHSTINRWVIKLIPLLAKPFSTFKRSVLDSWRMDETDISIRGTWYDLYRAVDKAGDTVDFMLSKHRDKKAARRFFAHALGQHGLPRAVVIDKSGAHTAALEADRRTTHQVPEQHRRARPSCDKANNPT